MKILDYAHWTPIPDIETKKQFAILGSPRPPTTREEGGKIYHFWLLFTILIASIMSTGATLYYYNKGETLLYDDAYSHLLIARRVMDNLTPGIDQIGGVWLPLQHLLMLPFIWNDFLWYTGLAGTIPSMISYIVAAGYLFCTLYRLTKQIGPSLIGVTIFLSNPNILYLQSTPLTEVMCTAAFVAAAYYLLRWLQSYELRYLIYTAIATFAATLIRYDGWALFLVVSVLVIATGIFNKHNRDLITDQVAVYLSIAPLGIAFWLIWNKMIFGDPLYFQRGPYSSQAHQLAFLHQGKLPTYHNMVTSFRVYIIDMGQTIGWGLFVCALLSLILVLIVYRNRQEYFILAILLVPFVFYVTSLFTGQSIMYLPSAGNTTLFNVRYGAQMTLPAAFLAARGSASLYSWVRRWYLKTIFTLICLAWIGVQVVSINASGILSLQDGLYGMSCINTAKPVIISLAQHYNGGRILVYQFTSDINPQLFGAHFSNIIWEGSGAYWQDALDQPTKFVNWVILNPYNPNDTVSRLLTQNRQRFLTSFRLMSSNHDGVQLYYRIGAPPLPTRPIPDDLLNRPNLCK